jgi:hypothetical protein
MRNGFQREVLVLAIDKYRELVNCRRTLSVVYYIAIGVKICSRVERHASAQDRGSFKRLRSKGNDQRQYHKSLCIHLKTPVWADLGSYCVVRRQPTARPQFTQSMRMRPRPFKAK